MGAQDKVGRNRPPRVHIRYKMDDGGAQREIELPFVMGVMSDLSGDTKDQKDVAERKFIDVSAGNFDEVMKGMNPSVKLTVPNALTGEGQLPVEMKFEKMEDFSPVAIARKVDPLRQLLEARTQLDNLLTFLDGREDLEEVVNKLLNNPEMLKNLANSGKNANGEEGK